MKLLWTAKAWEQYIHWQEADLSVLARINELLRDIKRSPFTGLGKPEPLKANLTGWWSRRITGDHRLVYRVSDKLDEQKIEIVQCRYHY